jgi:hypothetical protein
MKRDERIQAIITIAVMSSALYVILSGSYPDPEQKWAFGAIGATMGYWFGR